MPGHIASCHCGAVQVHFEAPKAVKVTLCNCSMCRRTGHKHVFIPQNEATLIGEENLSLYTFGSGAAKHYFCKICGTRPFYIPRSHPDTYSVNLRCIENDTLSASETIEFDGQNWDQNIAGLRSETES